jgi:hypothetical protein
MANYKQIVKPNLLRRAANCHALLFHRASFVAVFLHPRRSGSD